LRRRVRHDDPRRDAGFAGRPGESLREVAGAGGDDAAPDRARVGAADRVHPAADLEGADRLEVLELQPDVGLRQPEERRPHGGVADRLARRLDLGERDQKSTVVPRPVSYARRIRYSAAARSSIARPSDSKTVSSSGDVRPGARPASTSPSSALMWPSAIAPSCSAIT